MKRVLLITTAAMLVMCGCSCTLQKKLYTPEADKDKLFTTVGTEQKNDMSEPVVYDGDGYSIVLPEGDYNYEKDFEGGAVEETWEHKIYDDVKITVTTYKSSDEATARSRFLREHDDYIFEDLLGYPLCGMEKDGDTLWFNLYEYGGNVYIVSFEYDKNTKEKVITELTNTAGTFTLKKNNSTTENNDGDNVLPDYDSYELSAGIYLCDDVYRDENTLTHGSGTINFPVLYNIFGVADWQLLLCDDACEPEAVVSRASQGYAPAYQVVAVGEIDGNLKVLKFRMQMPEAMTEDLKKQGVYELISKQIERQYYYLIVLDEKHYTYIHLERKEDTPKTENEAFLADSIVKNAKINLDTQHICSYPLAPADFANESNIQN